MAKKGKFKTLALTVLCTALVLVGVGGIGYAIMKRQDYDITIVDEFDSLNIELEQSVQYTGSALEPTLNLTDEYTYTINSIKNSEGESVDEAVNIGTYIFDINVYKGSATRRYTIVLNIVSSLQLNNVSNSTQLKLSSIQTLSDTTSVVTYSVSGTLNASDVEGELSWITAKNATVTDYVTYSIDTSEQTITFTCLQAFDTTIRFFLRSTQLDSAAASILIQYQQKQLTTAGWEILQNNVNRSSSSYLTLHEGDQINIAYNNATYSDVYTLEHEENKYDYQISNIEFTLNPTYLNWIDSYISNLNTNYDLIYIRAYKSDMSGKDLYYVGTDTTSFSNNYSDFMNERITIFNSIMNSTISDACTFSFSDLYTYLLYETSDTGSNFVERNTVFTSMIDSINSLTNSYVTGSYLTITAKDQNNNGSDLTKTFVIKFNYDDYPFGTLSTSDAQIYF